ncbi:MAG TPA: arylsulfatase [Planctomycetota bacterium]|nr:arylsulfatase [Planctomycetota bacterium]
MIPEQDGLWNDAPMRTLSLPLLLLFVLPASARAQVEASQARRPNVVLLITDDQGYGDVAYHGNGMIQTPNMDSLAQQSVRLTDFHVDPTCSPTRAALMSGRYSTRTGVWHTIMGRSLMSADELTVAEVFAANDYRTGMFGKWHLGENFPLRPEDQGFDTVVRHGGGGVGQGPDYWGNNYFDDTYWRNGVPEKFEGYCTDIWFREAMTFIEDKGQEDRPFFCYLSTNAPHGPLLVDPKWSDPYVEKGVAANQAKFYGMIENIDWNLGQLLAQLDRLGIAENTIVIFMTDNGTAAGRVDAKRVSEGKWGGFNAGMRGNKGSEYEGGHRVPFFIRWPAGGVGGSTGKGKARAEDYLSAHIDVLPTLVGLCGLARPDGPLIDGLDLSALLREAGTRMPERTLFVHSQRIPDPEMWRKCSVMTERWRLVNGKELFDVQAEPGQSKDISAQHSDVVARLRTDYEAWWKSLSVVFDRKIRIGLGAEAEPVTQLHPHDWQVTSQNKSSWNQSHVRSGHMGQGLWFVNVCQAGRYEIELRRWPRHLDQGLEAVEAKIAIAGIEEACEVLVTDTQVTFTVDLKAGPTTLQTWFTLPNGKTRGAYFAYVTRS